MSTDFSSRLDQALDFAGVQSDPYGQTLKDLNEIVKAIRDKMNDGIAGDPIHVDIEPGFNATIGQQLKIAIRIPHKGFRDFLFRAYVPESGYPVNLDLYGEQPLQCATKEELENEILKFVARIRDRMATYREYAQ